MIKIQKYQDMTIHSPIERKGQILDIWIELKTWGGVSIVL